MKEPFATTSCSGQYCPKARKPSRRYRRIRDLKIVGYDGNEITRLVSPQVTTIAQNTKKLAETCVDVLNKRISGLDTEDRYFVPVKIRMGGTT